jgi:hypothetical protein
MTQKKKRKKIKRELPPVGSNLKGKFKGQSYSAKIVKDVTSSNGRAIRYDGKRYSSMTAAAKVITKQSVNGWRFWKF